MEIEEQGNLARKCDENTNFFHHFTNHRKKHNTIWEMKDEEGTWVRSHGR
jgi:hypothetical protein